VNPTDASVAVTASGLLALWMGLTDVMLKYLKPSMRPWLVLAGAVLVAIGLVGLLRARRREADGTTDSDHHGHTHRSGVGWLLTIPIVVVILLGPQSLGAFAAARGGTRGLPPYSFDIAAYAAAQGDDVPTLQLVDVQQGVRQRPNREFLTEHSVRLAGFVTREPSLGPHAFLLNRFLVSCCAADALPMRIAMVHADRIPKQEQWVVVTARLEAGHLDERPSSRSAGGLPTMHVEDIDLIDEPAGPYETLR
jgi:uncharacterized repeat protein (TIGR03943 family)